ncbi:calcium-binding protein [Novosphingobium mangrovi (ex Huang et al. 2023)]|uniref:Right-handed parallel beta-helix repeat-containing protein n=1 Tax=Novosphingobium mangrovi (ex Huang et al. 2023) TaxID=2976432 RepID=A0ABT2I178_9SPHN|nr:right-handed parallel beta-helix repeat-containing protein [Novosphingobium mangrovi (ex Huang et al. 2023)]MCT2398413.1 right-handed parallel beta-helix repeat-containing protein [Novosphingobium mangrovi (ex Huang et al. 2023)]
MTVFSVSSAAELNAALKQALGGDTIELAAGDYSSLTIKNKDFGSGITITSADPDNRAQIDGFKIIGSSGITFSNVDFTPPADAKSHSLLTYQSSNIHFDGITVTGPEGDAGYNLAAFMIRESSDVSVTNSEFSHLWHAVSILNNTGLTIADNYIHDIRTDGVRGGGNSDTVISNNYFTDFHPSATDHPDAIQLWANSMTQPSDNVTISDNVIYCPDGQSTQGIFIRDQAGDQYYTNVSITGNVVIGARGNGIAAEHIDGGTISGNIVAGLGDNTSWLRVGESWNVTVHDNTGTTITDASGGGADFYHNTVLDPIYDGGVALMNIYGDYIASILPPLADLPGSDLVQMAKTQFAETLAAQPEVTYITGTDGSDRLSVTNLGDTHIDGGDGRDIITGGLFHNELVGGNGNDVYHVNGTGDVVIEEANGGNDTVYAAIDYTLTDNVEILRMASEGLTGTGNALDNRMIGSDGTDTFYGMDGDDVIQGLAGDDVLHGGNGNDVLVAGTGNDTLYGDAGNDRLRGEDGNDVIFGGAGNDVIEGGAGVDTLWGGDGRDTFVFRPGDLDGTTYQNPEVIGDFSRAQGERLNLSALDANAATWSNEAFSWIGTHHFSGKAGELRYEVSAGNAIISGDTNGDGVADFHLELLGVSTLSSSDLIL